MSLDDVRLIFNRALAHTFSKKKLFFVFAVLILCGVLVVFFRGLAINANYWIILSLTFLPIFLCTGILLSTGIVLVRMYHDEIKKKPVSFKNIFSKSWEIVIGASYFSIPIILSYLLLWMMLGIFVLLKEIPGIGEFFSVILSFGPFLINLGTLVLCLLNISMLFFITPIVALKGLNRLQVSQILVKRLQGDVFSNLFLATIAVLPLLCLIGLLILSAFMTGAICSTCENPLHTVLQWFFMMIPFTAILTPAVIFFFNFAAEAHVLLVKNTRTA